LNQPFQNVLRNRFHFQPPFAQPSQDAAFLVDNVNKKANLEDVSTLESNLVQVTRQLSRLNEVLQEQNSAVRELNNRVTHLQEEVEDSRNPNFQQIFSYIDKQVRSTPSESHLTLLQVDKVVAEMNDRLSDKADVRDVERSIPQKVDEVYRNLLSQMNGLHKDLGRAVTKDEFHQLLATKVNLDPSPPLLTLSSTLSLCLPTHSLASLSLFVCLPLKAENTDVRTLLTEVSNCVSKQEMQSTLQLQIRPLITSLGSLEKVIQIQEDRRENTLSRASSQPPPSSASIHWTYDKIQTIIDDTLVQKYPHLNDTVTSVTVDQLMSQQREYLHNEIQRQQNEMRRETEFTEREFLVSIKKKYEEKFSEMNGGIRETRYSAV
jgi:hypothetical protein